MIPRTAHTVQAIGRWIRCRPLVPAGRRGRAVATTLLAALLVVSTTALTLNQIDALPDGAAFRVNTTVVSEQQLAQRVKLLTTLYGLTAPTDPAGLDRFRRTTAKAIAISEVIDDAARTKGIVIADKTANDQLANIIGKIFPQGQDGLDQELAREGINRQDLIDEIKRQLSTTELYDQVTSGVTPPTDQQVAQTYEERRAHMQVPEKRHLRNIVVTTVDQANQIRAQLASGADFAALAAQNSLDETTKIKGGDLGEVTRDQLEKPYADAAFATSPNTVFGPVQTDHGFNIGQVLDITPAIPLSLDQVREQLRADLLDQYRQNAWNTWLSQQLKAGHIRYADTYRPTAPDTITPP